MQSTESVLGAPGRIFGGLFAGTVLGLVIEVFFLSGPPEDKRILLIGPGIGGVLLAIVAFFFGERELQGWFKIVSISFVTGVAIGGVGGAVVFPVIMVAIDGAELFFHGKVYGLYANIGAMFGVPIGAATGIFVGFAIWFWKQKRRFSPCEISGGPDGPLGAAPCVE